MLEVFIVIYYSYNAYFSIETDLNCALTVVCYNIKDIEI